MLIIYERIGKVTNFLAPAMVVAIGVMLLNLFKNLFVTFLIFINFVSTIDILILSLFISFLSQVVGVIIVYFLVIPLMKAKVIQKKPFTSRNLGRTVLVICFTFTLNIMSNYIFNFIFDFINLTPQSGYTNIFLNLSHLTNPLNIIIYYLPLTLGAPVFEEFLYRRTLIPMLEKRGMAPLTAILTSSIVFSIGHFPNDLINGNIFGGIMHCAAVFFISISLGIVYVLTRNIIFPIILHSFINFVSFSGPLLIVLGNELLLYSYNFAVLTIAVMGIGVLLYCFWRYFKRSSTDWVIILKERSIQKIIPGVIVFLMICTLSAFIPSIIDMLSVMELMRSNNYPQYLTSLLTSYIVAVFLFFWLGTRFRFTPIKKLESEVYSWVYFSNVL